MLVRDAELEVVGELDLDAREHLVHVLGADAGRDEHAARAEEALGRRLRGGVEAADAVGPTDARIARTARLRAATDGERLRVARLRAERAVVDVHRDRLEEPAPRAEDLAAALLGRIPDQADARGEVAVEDHRVLAEPVAGERVDAAAQVRRVPQPLLLVAQAGVERQVRQQAPRVAQVRGPVDRLAVDERARRTWRAREVVARVRHASAHPRHATCVGRGAPLVEARIGRVGWRELHPPCDVDRASDEVLDERAARVEARRALHVLLQVEARLELVLREPLGDADPPHQPLLAIACQRAGAADRVRVDGAVVDERVRIGGDAIRASLRRPRALAAEARPRAERARVEHLARDLVGRGIERARARRRAVHRDDRLDLGLAAAELRGPAQRRVGREPGRHAAGRR